MIGDNMDEHWRLKEHWVLYLKYEGQEDKTGPVCVGRVLPVGGRRGLTGRVKEGEYGSCTLYLCIK
jgi:hypothetical protein